MNPNPDITPALPESGPASSQPLVEFVRARREVVAYILLGLSLAFLGLSIWFGTKAFRSPAAKEESTPAKVDPMNPDESLESQQPIDPNRGDYIVGLIGALLGFAITVGVGVWQLAALPHQRLAAQQTEAREVILSACGLLGALLIVFGIVFFYRWSASLTAWVDQRDAKDLKWVAIPFLMVVVGAGALVGAVQPARADERNNTTIRRLVYGSNLGLSVLLLFVALIVGNVLVGIRVPNRLDTTETGFYTLSETSEKILSGLDQPVTAYAILRDSGSRSTADIRRLLQTAADSVGSKLKVKFVSPVTNRSELRALMAKYPQVELNETGVLLTVGEDEKRHSFLREDEFTESTPSMPGQPRGGSISFSGENRLIRELLFLAENKQKPIVYFTQSAGELDISGGGSGREDTPSPTASGAKLKTFLEKNYLEIRPLKFDLTAPKVPDDAAVLIVAEPRAVLSEAVAGAIRKYMTEPRPDNKKGKLLVLAGPQFGADGKVLKTGLETLLAEFKINVVNRLILGLETPELGLDENAVGFTVAAVRAKNPVAVSLGEKVIFPATGCRPVLAVSQGPDHPAAPSVRAIPLLATASPGRYSWLEEERPTNLNQLITQVLKEPAIQRAKQLSNAPRFVGVVASEGEVGRVAVIGNGNIASDAYGSPDGSAPITYDLVSGLIDWLRDRPTISQIESKKYKEYTFPAVSDETRILWLPLAIGLLAIGGLGAGVWVIRRK